MRRFVLSGALPLLFVLISIVLPDSAAAQITPADSASILLETGSRFQAEGQSDVARAIFRYVADHFGDTPAGARARTFLVSVRDEGTAGNGRVELQVFSALYGLWLGVAVPGAFGADDPEPYGIGLLLGGPAGFLAGKAIASSRPLTEGQARAITLGATWGTWQGGGWASVLDLGHQEVCYDDAAGPGGTYCYEDGDGSEELFTAMIVGGVSGMALGTVLSKHSISPGVATAVNSGALWGTWFGFAGGYLADLEDDALLAATLLGGDAGLVATAIGAPRWNPSRSRARLVSLYGIIGGLGGLGIDLLAQPDDEKVALGIPLAGSVLGLAIGVGVTRDYDARMGAGAGEGAGEGMAGLADGALFSLRAGAWGMGTPLPYPVMVERPGPKGPQKRAALGVTLLSARFF